MDLLKACRNSGRAFRRLLHNRDRFPAGDGAAGNRTSGRLVRVGDMARQLPS